MKYYVHKAETSFPKCRDFVLLQMMQCTKAEMFIHVPETFIHVAVQNLTMRLTYTELRITADNRQFPVNCVVCPTTLVRYVIISSQI